MGKKTSTNNTEPKERASVSRERRLALALRAVLDDIEAGNATDTSAAAAVLEDLGYNELQGIPKRVAALEAELQAAFESKDYGRVTELGKELERAKAGKPAVTTAA